MENNIYAYFTVPNWISVPFLLIDQFYFIPSLFCLICSQSSFHFKEKLIFMQERQHMKYPTIKTRWSFLWSTQFTAHRWISPSINIGDFWPREGEYSMPAFNIFLKTESVLHFWSDLWLYPIPDFQYLLSIFSNGRIAEVIILSVNQLPPQSQRYSNVNLTLDDYWILSSGKKK